ncbi:FmdE family protein [Desulfospira joergensenii]|uniref:FmdE family protein n=1 Tax=Desulfospira joergensenii TaxID=53329 RepID=UPI0003B43473|nr:FmdE family protein [Desulfospira joergensenii]
MNAQTIMETKEFKKCEDFHGHVCPGLSIGFRAAREGMKRLRETRAADEEMVAVVETDACSADAVQVLTGCTFGKGNFIYKDYGKMALTLFSRNTGEGVRLALKHGALDLDPEHRELLQKVVAGQASEEEQSRFDQLHLRRSRDILELDLESLFQVQSVSLPVPEKAKVEPSQACAQCGEPVMPSKMEPRGSEKICRGCARD